MHSLIEHNIAIIWVSFAFCEMAHNRAAGIRSKAYPGAGPCHLLLPWLLLQLFLALPILHIGRSNGIRLAVMYVIERECNAGSTHPASVSQL